MSIEVLTNELLKHKETNKSLLFLYPLLFFHDSIPDPIETYMGFKDYSENEYELICLYHTDNIRFKEINRTYKEHERYKTCFVEKGFIYYIMDFSNMRHTYSAIKAGQYSTIKDKIKRAINVQKRIEFIHDIGLYPERHKHKLIDEFKIRNGVPIGRDILDPPNPSNEYITLPAKFLDRVL